MSLLDAYKTSRAIAALLSAKSPASPQAKQAVAKLKQIGPASVPKLIDSVETATNTEALENLLLTFLDNSTLPFFLDGLNHESRRAAASVVRVLSRSNRYDPNRLLDLFQDPDVSNNMLADILATQKQKLNVRNILNLLEKLPPNTRPLLYQLIDELVSPDLLPDIIQRTQSDDAGIRARMAAMLARFDDARARETLIGLLADPSKHVRQTALESLATIKTDVPVAPICNLLRDTDLTVQAKAIETLTKLRDPSTIHHLIEILQDESEYVRRGAVEVLNEVGDQSAIKDLLNALRDADWWVRVRAGDALGTIGGPKVVEAVLALIKDEDEFLRRTAIEILNTSKDERAFGYLVDALEDEDWWVRERAADALAELGDDRAVEHLVNMLGQEPQTTQVAIRALAALNDKRAIDPILKHLKSGDDGVRREAAVALEKLTDAQHARYVQDAVTQLMTAPDAGVKDLATQVMKTVVARFGDHVQAGGPPLDSTVLSIDRNNETMVDLASDPEPLAVIDAAALPPGRILGDRYRVIRHVGKGAFGVVVLVEDNVVQDQFILKFLNPHVASDESMIQRFVQELRYTRRITHENVIRIYDFLTFGKSYAISMEYFESHSLADELKNGKPMDLQRGIAILKEICEGMNAAQAADVVHRDLKPANILISDKDVVKIVDFGLAAAASHTNSRITKSGILVGTPTYMAPEQVRGKNVDSRTDIYSLGIIMYEMFAGRPPYEGEDPMAILFKHVEGKATLPREINSSIPEALENLILKAMAAAPEDRFENFTELRNSLTELSRELA